MNTLLLIIAGSLPQSTLPLPQCTLPPLAAPKPAPPRARPAPVAPIRGLHSHRCAACGAVWSHGSDSHGNRAAHTCPRCGRIQWQRANGTTDAPRFTLPQTADFCPT